MAKARETFLEPTPEAGRELFSRTIPGNVVMLNLLRFRAVADYSATPELAPASPITGEAAYRLYVEHTIPHLVKSGGEVLFFGRGGRFLIGPDEERWDAAMLVRQESLGAFLAFASDVRYQSGLGHRTAALEDSRLLPLVEERAGDAVLPRAARTTTGPGDRLRRVVTAACPQLEAISQELSGVPRSEGKWSPREIVGHLVDSASNNHGRFVRAQFADDLLCAGYDQAAWVACQRYSSAPWLELVALWTHLNLHLARVMEACPPDARSRPRRRHNLHEVAFRPISPAEPATLEYFMTDYVDHLEHHLAQILGGPMDAAVGAGEPGA